MDYSVKTHQGKRKNNQDFAGVFINKSNVLLSVLGDGLGGHRAGDIASEMAVSQLGNAWEKTDFTENDLSSIKDWLKIQINEENKRIYNVAQKYSDLEGMGTTLVTAVILKEKILISNVGDSRAYTYKNEKLKQRTEDHSFVSELQRKGELTAEEAKNHYNKSALTRSLGVKEGIKIDFFQPLRHSAAIIMLNSDGLTNVVEDEEIINILADEKLSIDERSEKLVQSAVKNEGSDNVTVLLINLNELKNLEKNKVGEN